MGGLLGSVATYEKRGVRWVGGGVRGGGGGGGCVVRIGAILLKVSL